MDLLRTTALVAATITMGLMAGLFYAFGCSVMIGLRQAGDRTFVEAMQRINVGILNGWFALIFGGSLVFTGLTGAMHLGADTDGVRLWVGGAFILYAAALAVTFMVNIPLNNELDAVGEPGTAAEAAAAREGFERRWVRWNLVRAVASTAAFGCLVFGRSCCTGSDPADHIAGRVASASPTG